MVRKLEPQPGKRKLSSKISMAQIQHRPNVLQTTRRTTNKPIETQSTHNTTIKKKDTKEKEGKKVPRERRKKDNRQMERDIYRRNAGQLPMAKEIRRHNKNKTTPNTTKNKDNI